MNEIITTVNCTEKIRKGNFKQMELTMDIVNPFPIWINSYVESIYRECLQFYQKVPTDLISSSLFFCSSCLCFLISSSLCCFILSSSSFLLLTSSSFLLASSSFWATIMKCYCFAWYSAATYYILYISSFFFPILKFSFFNSSKDKYSSMFICKIDS